MIRSTNRKLGEYDLIRRPEHIAGVWEIVEASLPKYWRDFIDRERQPDPIAELAIKLGSSRLPKPEPDGKILARVFEKALESYEKDAHKYRRFFETESLEEFQDDPNAFKQALSRDVPVIANTLRQRRAELKEWQLHFRAARANELLEVFCNVIEFAEEWSAAHLPAAYTELDDPAQFGLDPLDDDESMFMWNVVGMGIKSIVLYHLDPQRLPARGRDGLYGLYFLSGRNNFGLPSDSSEFLMVNDINPAFDGSIIMDQNYWYPYGLYSFYALQIFKWMEPHAKAAGITLDHSIRYVYVQRFFEAICAQHTDDLKTMRAHERFEVPV